MNEDYEQDLARLRELRDAIQAGIDSGVADGDVLERVRARIRKRAQIAKMDYPSGDDDFWSLSAER